MASFGRVTKERYDNLKEGRNKPTLPVLSAAKKRYACYMISKPIAWRLQLSASISCGPRPAMYDCRGWNRPATRIEHPATLSSAAQSDMTRIEALLHVIGTSVNCTTARSLIFRGRPRACVNLGLVRRTGICKARFIANKSITEGS